VLKEMLGEQDQDVPAQCCAVCSGSGLQVADFAFGDVVVAASVNAPGNKDATAKTTARDTNKGSGSSSSDGSDDDDPGAVKFHGLRNRLWDCYANTVFQLLRHSDMAGDVTDSVVQTDVARLHRIAIHNPDILSHEPVLAAIRTEQSHQSATRIKEFGNFARTDQHCAREFLDFMSSHYGLDTSATLAGGRHGSCESGGVRWGWWFSGSCIFAWFERNLYKTGRKEVSVDRTPWEIAESFSPHGSDGACYNLLGVGCHNGDSSKRGHYVAHIRARFFINGSLEEHWVMIDDERVEPGKPPKSEGAVLVCYGLSTPPLCRMRLKSDVNGNCNSNGGKTGGKGGSSNNGPRTMSKVTEYLQAGGDPLAWASQTHGGLNAGGYVIKSLHIETSLIQQYINTRIPKEVRDITLDASLTLIPLTSPERTSCLHQIALRLRPPWFSTRSTHNPTRHSVKCISCPEGEGCTATLVCNVNESVVQFKGSHAEGVDTANLPRPEQSFAKTPTNA
jgi:hypothetical protein